jgi:hypothetical protein
MIESSWSTDKHGVANMAAVPTCAAPTCTTKVGAPEGTIGTPTIESCLRRVSVLTLQLAPVQRPTQAHAPVAFTPAEHTPPFTHEHAVHRAPQYNGKHVAHRVAEEVAPVSHVHTPAALGVPRELHHSRVYSTTTVTVYVRVLDPSSDTTTIENTLLAPDTEVFAEDAPDAKLAAPLTRIDVVWV